MDSDGGRRDVEAPPPPRGALPEEDAVDAPSGAGTVTQGARCEHAPTKSAARRMTGRRMAMVRRDGPAAGNVPAPDEAGIPHLGPIAAWHDRSTIIPAMDHIPRYVPARTNQGWPVVGLIAALTVALIVMVTVIHQRTYKHPTDPTWHAVGGANNATKGAGH